MRVFQPFHPGVRCAGEFAADSATVARLGATFALEPAAASTTPLPWPSDLPRSANRGANEHVERHTRFATGCVNERSDEL